MSIFFLFLVFILIVIAAIVVYKAAGIHELQKMRTAFENRRNSLECLIKQSSDDEDYYLGELHALEELEDLIDEELENLEEL